MINTTKEGIYKRNGLLASKKVKMKPNGYLWVLCNTEKNWTDKITGGIYIPASHNNNDVRIWDNIYDYTTEQRDLLYKKLQDNGDYIKAMLEANETYRKIEEERKKEIDNSFLVKRRQKKLLNKTEGV